jgi:hypothetical protein
MSRPLFEHEETNLGVIDRPSDSSSFLFVTEFSQSLEDLRNLRHAHGV